MGCELPGRWDSDDARTGLIGRDRTLAHGDLQILGIQAGDDSLLCLPLARTHRLDDSAHARQEREERENDVGEDNERIETECLIRGETLVPEELRPVEDGFDAFEHKRVDTG